MKKTNYSLVLIGLVFVLFFVWIYLSLQEHSKDQQKNKYYHLNMDFTNITGIFKGSVVTINGVPVGEVASTALDENNSIVSVDIIIERKYKLPIDSVSNIYTDGLLGANYINITPGNSDEYLEENDTFEYTQNSLPIIDFIKILLNKIEIKK